MYSYNGRILHVDVGTQKTWVEEVSPEFLKKYIGGVGLATRLVYDNTPKGCDPLGPDNALCFAISAFAGTTVPVGTKHSVASKSPLTGFIGDSLSGSHFSEMLRHAGWDGIVIKGQSPKWIVLFIDDDDVQFLDASHLLGKGTTATQKAIRTVVGRREHPLQRHRARGREPGALRQHRQRWPAGGPHGQRRCDGFQAHQGPRYPRIAPHYRG